MTGFVNEARKRIKSIRASVAGTKIAATIIISALLMPIAAPIPAWAQNLYPATLAGDGMQLPSPHPTLAASAVDLAFNSIEGAGAYISKMTKTVNARNAPGSRPYPVKPAPLPTPTPSLLPRPYEPNPVGKDSFNQNMAPTEPPEPTPTPTPEPPPAWSSAQWQSFFTPENNLGSPPGQSDRLPSGGRMRERIGAANFSFGVPVISIPGRGIDASAEIIYNSRVWNKVAESGSTTFTYNVDRNWLAPGFNLSYGRMESYVTSNPAQSFFSVVDPDGTRHEIRYREPVPNGNGWSIYEATDGSFIRTYFYNGKLRPENIAVSYSDGSKVIFGPPDDIGTRYAIRVIDKNGNNLWISYLTGGKIAKIKDTLDREIVFNYDDNPDVTKKKLVAITVPGYETGLPRQVIRFYYQDLEIQPRFNGIAYVGTSSVVTGQTSNFPTVTVLRYVYFPGTQSGYRYDYSPDDPAWTGKTMFGIIWRVRELRGMAVSNSSDLTSTGSVTSDGETANETTYNYPKVATDLQNNVPLGDVPKYTERSDDWIGRPAGDPPKYTFSSSDRDALVCPDTPRERVTQTIDPEGRISETVSVVKENSWNDGLPCQSTLRAGSGENTKVWSKQKFFWEQGTAIGGRNNPRLVKVETTNDAGQTRATIYAYDGFNNPTIVRELDFAAPGSEGAELRRTETTYETGSGWTQVNLIRLPKIVKTISGGQTVSRTEYEYDKGGVASTVDPPTQINRTDVTNQSPEYNSYWDHNILVCNSQGCVWVIVYYPEEDFHGDVTKVVKYSDATKEQESQDPEAVKTTFDYDIVGNRVSAGLNCCNRREWEYTNVNNYAYPLSVTSGDVGQLTTSATYDLNTGLVKTSIDENNQETRFTYEPGTLRQKRVDYPNGAWSQVDFNDTQFPYSIKSTSSLDAARSVSSWGFFDGRGRNFRGRSLTANGYLSSDVEFDQRGRPEKSYNPYTVAGLNDDRPSGIKFSQIIERDGLDRALVTKLADDTTVQSSYSGLTATMTDQAGKQRRQTADTLGRIKRVDEPNKDGLLDVGGSPAQPTYYEYDGNDNLTKVTQSGDGALQVREFQYDSLSRLRRERQVEAKPTLDINAQHGPEDPAKWTGIYKY